MNHFTLKILSVNIPQTTENYDLRVPLSNGEILLVWFDEGCQLKQIEQNIILLSGELIGTNLTDFCLTLVEKGISILNQVDGHFCGVLLQPGRQPLLFRDRFGARSLYYTKLRSPQALLCCTHWHTALSAVNHVTWDAHGLAEALNYRYLADQHTLFNGLEQIPYYHCATANSQGLQLHRFWTLPEAKVNKAITLDEAKNITQEEIEHCLESAAKQYPQAAVLLSGGVDSAILAALAKPIFTRLVAYTPVFKNGRNPELETAKRFAEILKLPHKLVEVDENQLKTDLNYLVMILGAPLRHYSTLALCAVIKQIPSDIQAILFGETADTLFGTNIFKRLVNYKRWKRQAQFLPDIVLRLMGKFINRANLMQQLKKRPINEILLELDKIEYFGSAKQIIASLTRTKIYQRNIADCEQNTDLIYRGKNLFFGIHVPQHYKEIELCATQFSKVIISPFHRLRLQQLTAQLKRKLYFGGSFVKPVLRELACDYFPRELIYQKKWGFPVPQINWLEEQFYDDILTLYDANTWLSKIHLPIAQHYEFFWVLINLQILTEKLSEQLITNPLDNVYESHK